MRSYKVVEENKSGNKVIGTGKRTKTTLCFIPGFKSIIKGFNNIIGNIIFERLYFDVSGNGKDCFNSHIIRPISISNNELRSSVLSGITKERESLRRTSVRRQVEANNKPCFRVNNKPNKVLFAIDLNNGFISMPFIRVKINRIMKPGSNAMKQESKLFSPGSNSYMRNLNTIVNKQELRDFSCRNITKVKHIQGSNNNMQRESHSFVIYFTKEGLTGSIVYSISFNDRKSVITLFITTAILSIILIVIVNKSSFTALWAFGISL